KRASPESRVRADAERAVALRAKDGAAAVVVRRVRQVDTADRRAQLQCAVARYLAGDVEEATGAHEDIEVLIQREGTAERDRGGPSVSDPVRNARRAAGLDCDIAGEAGQSRAEGKHGLACPGGVSEQNRASADAQSAGAFHRELAGQDLDLAAES